MPENYYCLDNFFYKMTDLESPRKNNDCYFYYYSTCTKGDSCTFRHEPSALGCETTCSFWKEGKCINVHCNFRHMELRKNRKSIPCYWESQPGGCKKPHCPFLHSSPKSGADIGETSDLKSNDMKESDICNKKSSEVDNNFGPVVDPLVVNFEEESDNESAPTQSPIKTQRVVKVKTLEEIKLERIQAESAAYYSYPEDDKGFEYVDEADFLRNRIIRRMNTKQEKTVPDVNKIEILSLDEIRKRKRSEAEPKQVVNVKRPKIALPIRKTAQDLSEIKIKTLAEIKAERALRFGLQTKRKMEDSIGDVSNKKRHIEEVSSSEYEVSSTSIIESSDEINKVQCIVTPVQRVEDKEAIAALNKPRIIKITKGINPPELKINTKRNNIPKIDLNTKVKNVPAVEINKKEIDSPVTSQVKIEKAKDEIVEEISIPEKCDSEDALLDGDKLDLDSSKFEHLLLEEDDEDTAISLQTDDEILKDIDSLLND